MPLSDYNFNEDEELALIQKQLADAHRRFRDLAFDGESPAVCRLHDIFGGDGIQHHNCIGCNLADGVQLIDAFLATHASQRKIQFGYTTLITLCYLLVERLDTIFNLIQLNADYRDEQFKILTTLRKWANFIKHPKAFVLTHHAVFTFHGSPKNQDLEAHATVVIDRNFVNQYYSDNEKNDDLYRKLENRDDVLVILPSAEHVVNELSKAINETVKLFQDNKVYRDVLDKRSTFLDFWVAEPVSGK